MIFIHILGGETSVGLSTIGEIRDKFMTFIVFVEGRPRSFIIACRLLFLNYIFKYIDFVFK